MSDLNSPLNLARLLRATANLLGRPFHLANRSRAYAGQRVGDMAGPADVALSAAQLDDVVGDAKVKCESIAGDRRRADRFFLGRPADVVRQADGAPDVHQRTMIREASRGGVGLLHPFEFEVGERFIVRLPCRSGQTLAVRCTVVRSEPGGAGGHMFSVGARFDAIVAAEAEDDDVQVGNANEAIRLRRAA